MAIQICPECNTHVENAEICPKCGYAFPQIDKESVYAACAKLETYDKRSNLYFLCIIPVFALLLLTIFVHTLFIIFFIASMIAMPVLMIRVTKKRNAYMLEICTDKNSMVNYIKQQNKNAMSIMQDKRKEGAAAYAILFTCESNPSAKSAYNTFNNTVSVLTTLMGVSLCFLCASLLENCNFDIPSGALFSDASSTGILFLIGAIIELICTIILIIISKKFNKKMYTYVGEWLKSKDALQQNVSANPNMTVQNQPAKESEDEYDLSNLDLGDL